MDAGGLAGISLSNCTLGYAKDSKSIEFEITRFLELAEWCVSIYSSRCSGFRLRLYIN